MRSSICSHCLERQRELAKYVTCPVCGRDSFYTPAMDRFTHADGSTNQCCWITLSSNSLEIRRLAHA